MNILLIQILRLGDALQITPIAKGIRTLYPEARIGVVTSSLGKIIDYIDDVYVIHKEELSGLVRKADILSTRSALDLLDSDLKPILSKKWDWVINLSFSFPSVLLAFLAHGKKNSGFYATKHSNTSEYHDSHMI